MERNDALMLVDEVIAALGFGGLLKAMKQNAEFQAATFLDDDKRYEAHRMQETAKVLTRAEAAVLA